MPPLSADPSRTQAGGVSACQAKRFQAARLSASIASSATPSYLGSSRTNSPLGSNLRGVSRSAPSPSSLNAPILGSLRSEEHTSELQSLMRISYAVFCLKKKNTQHTKTLRSHTQNTRI